MPTTCMIGKIPVLAKYARSAARKSGKSRPIWGRFSMKQLGARGATMASSLPSTNHCLERLVGRDGRRLDLRRQRHRHLLVPSRLLDAAGAPAQIGRADAVLVLQDAARPDRRRDLVFRHADDAALEIGGRPDAAIGPDIDRRMAEGARDEGGDRDIRRVVAVEQHEVAAQRELGDVELGMAQGAEERLLDRQRKERGIAAFDRHPAVNQRTGAIVVQQATVSGSFIGSLEAIVRRERHREPKPTRSRPRR